MRARVFVASLLVLGAAYSGCNCGSPSSRPAIVGVVIDVEAARLGEVESFTLKRGDDTMRIFIDPGASYSFPPAHLNDHLASSDPLRVETEERNGRLVAVAIEDA